MTFFRAGRPDLFPGDATPMSNIYVERPHTPQEVLEVVTDRLPAMMSQHDIGLIGLGTASSHRKEKQSTTVPLPLHRADSRLDCSTAPPACSIQYVRMDSNNPWAL